VNALLERRNITRYDPVFPKKQLRQARWAFEEFISGVFLLQSERSQNELRSVLLLAKEEESFKVNELSYFGSFMIAMTFDSCCSGGLPHPEREALIDPSGDPAVIFKMHFRTSISRDILSAERINTNLPVAASIRVSLDTQKERHLRNSTEAGRQIDVNNQ
jgi:hypothetical protein